MRHHIKQLILLFFLVSFSVVNVDGQYIVERYFPDMKIDSIWILDEGIGIKSNQNGYLMRGNHIQSTDIPGSQSMSPSFYFQDSTVTSFSKFQDGFLLIINSRLYYFDGSSLRQFSLPVDGIVEDISAISICGGDFALIASGNIWIWENESYAYYPVEFEGDVKFSAANCDDWGGYWVSDGESIYSILKDEGIALPELKVHIEENHITDEQEVIFIDSKDILFSVTSSHTLWKDIRVQYQMEGSGDDWVTIDNDSEINVPLMTGRQNIVRFRSTVDSMYFVYNEPFKIIRSERSYLTWWWYLISIPLIMVIAGWWINRKERIFQKSLQEEKEKYKLKSDALVLQNQVDRMKMDPHFIFNVLTGLQGLISAGENKTARKVLSRFSSIMRYMLKENSKERIPIEEEISFLRSYLILEQISRNQSFDFEIINETTESTTIPPMLIQPLAENSIIHGFKGIDHRGKIMIHFSESDEFIVCKVDDNGIGRKASSSAWNSGDHNAMALETIEKRLGTISKFSKGRLFFEDKTKGTASLGTTAIVEIPY